MLLTGSPPPRDSGGLVAATVDLMEREVQTPVRTCRDFVGGSRYNSYRRSIEHSFDVGPSHRRRTMIETLSRDTLDPQLIANSMLGLDGNGGN